MASLMTFDALMMRYGADHDRFRRETCDGEGVRFARKNLKRFSLSSHFAIKWIPPDDDPRIHAHLYVTNSPWYWY